MPENDNVAALAELLDAEVVLTPLAAINAIDDMDYAEYKAWLEAEDGNIVTFEGSQWTLIKDKSKLEGVPFVIAKMRFNAGTQGNFVSVCAFLEDGKKIVFNDGGKGVYEACKRYEANGRTTGVFVPGGLHASHYTFDDDGVERAATTYYFA